MRPALNKNCHQMGFLDDPKYRWEKDVSQTYTLHFWRHKAFNVGLSQDITKAESLNEVINRVKQRLKNNVEYTSGVFESADYYVAWVDHIRAMPIYYTLKEDAFYLSNNAHMLRDKAQLDTFDENAELEFGLSGYVVGSKTLLKDLYTLQPGEFLVWDKKEKALHTHHYFEYKPDFSQETSWADNEQKLGDILDALIQKTIQNANGKTIWVPLSAGLDSRILLCKLHEHGYENIQTFTYGPKYNFEAKHAKKIAHTLDVPWQMITLSSKTLKNYFDSDMRKEFWAYADGLKTIPCMREFSAIYYLYKNKIAQAGDIFLNGQSGDYITGGHIPAQWCSDTPQSVDAFMTQLIEKHYDLWFDLKTPKNIMDMKESILSLLPDSARTLKTGLECAYYSEIWEYKGRQICYVVNGQRTYEFFGYEWDMPLWEKTLVDFCQNLPIAQKKDQALYKKYLKTYNYKGLFPEKEPYIWRWPLPMLWVVGVAQIIGVLRGKRAKNMFYTRMKYYGHYANQYVFFSKALHIKTYKKCRSVVSLYIPVWQAENNPHSKYLCFKYM